MCLSMNCYRMHFRGVIDYIFYSPAHLRRAGMLPGVDFSWFAQNEVPACPHVNIPSDHIPLMAEFELLPSLAGANSMGVMSGGIGSLGSNFVMGGGGVASAAPMAASQHHSSLFAGQHQYASLHATPFEPYSTPPHQHSSQSHSSAPFGGGPGHPGPGQPSPPPPHGSFYSSFASPPNLASGAAPPFSGFSSYNNPTLGSGTSRIRTGGPTGQSMPPLAPPLSLHSISQAAAGPGGPGPGQHFSAPHQQFYSSNEQHGGQRLYRR